MFGALVFVVRRLLPDNRTDFVISAAPEWSKGNDLDHLYVVRAGSNPAHGNQQVAKRLPSIIVCF